jgi:hypothetical protein
MESIRTEEAQMTEATTHTIDAPGAVLTYDVRSGSDADKTPLLMVASPMVVAGFTTLADHFTDRTVVTYDPRQSERSRLTSDADPTPGDTCRRHPPGYPGRRGFRPCRCPGRAAVAR